LNFQTFSKDYLARLKSALDIIPPEPLQALAEALMLAWREKRQVFIFGNGGSAGNAIHLANDFLYGISREFGHALRVTALPANSAVLTCLANDEGYDGIFFRQLAVLANKGDVAIAFSGSGNSPNILKALESPPSQFWVTAVARPKLSQTMPFMFRSTTCRSVKTCSSWWVT